MALVPGEEECELLCCVGVASLGHAATQDRSSLCSCFDYKCSEFEQPLLSCLGYSTVS